VFCVTELVTGCLIDGHSFTACRGIGSLPSVKLARREAELMVVFAEICHDLFSML
jgi:hypothetical protein